MNKIQIKNNFVLLFTFLAGISVLSGLAYAMDTDFYSEEYLTESRRFVSLYNDDLSNWDGNPESYSTTSDNAY